MPLARLDRGRFLCARPSPAGVAFDSAAFVGPFLYASSGTDVWRTAFREPRAGWTRLLAVVELAAPLLEPLVLMGTETDLYARGRDSHGMWFVVHINKEDGCASPVRRGLSHIFAAATRFYEIVGRPTPVVRVRGADDALLEEHYIALRSVLVCRPDYLTCRVPLPESALGWCVSHVADDVVVLTDPDGGVAHYRPSTMLAVSHAAGAPPRERRLPLSPRVFLASWDACGSFFRSADPERGLPLPVRVVGRRCRVINRGSQGSFAVAVVQEHPYPSWARVRSNAHCSVVLLGHMHGDVSGDHIAGGDGQGKLALFWHVPLGTSLDILLGPASGARASNIDKALRLGPVRVLLGQLLGAHEERQLAGPR